MNERSILIAQIQALVQELGKAENALDSPQIDQAFRKRVRVRFDKLIKKQQSYLKNLQSDVEHNLPLDACWDNFRGVRQESTPLFRECLAFIEGALARGAGLDEGLCRMADALLDDLSHLADISWGRFTILAEGEFLVDMTEIIRMRFPEVSIWNLPIAAHEFGHFIGPALEVHGADGKSRHPFQEILEREKLQNGPKSWSYLHEYFSDLFATYAIGPAFACTCILLRFDPATAYEDGVNHPCAAKRVYFMLKMLKKMDEDEGGLIHPYRDIIEKLDKLWMDSLITSGKPGILKQEDTPKLDELFDELYLMMAAELPKVRYEGLLGTIQRLMSELSPDKDAPPMLKPEDTLADVLNAAWLCRIQQDGNNYTIRQIGDRAVRMCKEIINRV